MGTGNWKQSPVRGHTGCDDCSERYADEWVAGWLRELLIWHYSGPSGGRRFYKKGGGTGNTLEALITGKGYVGIVPTAGG